MNDYSKRYELGYKCSMTKQQKLEFKQLFFEKSYWKGLSITFVYIASIYAVLILAAFVSSEDFSAIATSFIWAICAIFVTRQMRALENVVHFGSHSNFGRDRPINDLITNCIAAWPMLQDVTQYRKFHALHHGDYGSHEDPCRARFEAIGADCGDVTNNRQLVLAILRWMPLYVREFYREVKSNGRQLAIFLLWHCSAIGMIYLTFGLAIAAQVLVTWLVCMFGILPFLRSIAEFSEHDYERADNVKETTFNNLGLIDHLILHPAGDAWHALHHLYPVVPWWKQGAAHHYLMANDTAYRNALHRDQLFQDIMELPSSRQV